MPLNKETDETNKYRTKTAIVDLKHTTMLRQYPPTVELIVKCS